MTNGTYRRGWIATALREVCCSLRRLIFGATVVTYVTIVTFIDNTQEVS